MRNTPTYNSLSTIPDINLVLDFIDLRCSPYHLKYLSHLIQLTLLENVLSFGLLSIVFRYQQKDMNIDPINPADATKPNSS